MTLCRMGRAPLELEEEAFRLADEWVEIDTLLSLNEYIYVHASPSLKEHIDATSKLRSKHE